MARRGRAVSFGCSCKRVVFILGVTCILVTLGAFPTIPLFRPPSAGIPRGADEDPTIFLACDPLRNHTCALDENRHLRRALKSALQAEASCVCTTRQQTAAGGYCLQVDQAGIVSNDNNKTDYRLASQLLQLFPGQSVLDLGCGLGGYGRVLTSAGVNWAGYDGAPNVEEVTKGFVKFADVSKNIWLGQQYDWVMSLEVGEHIPKAFADNYLQNILRHARKHILISWAVPGQHGSNHINEQPNEFVIDWMKAHGFIFDLEMAQKLRSGSQFGWFRTTIMVFHAQ